ncbi:unnamed protein product [Protopolystoma xenopodis]|uniref:Uncharacterized protein n=1 Tax=Protopolystoma xenopodis TaxID=117903 RepID=A0A448WMJ3_9PLAT|nr:unnamed protein product [Protopolystoma xenopodis]
MARDDFAGLQRRLMAVPLFQLVTITNFIQDLFVSTCQQTSTRHIYPFPTVAIDRRNVDRVFDSCKDILQGKALTELMV